MPYAAAVAIVCLIGIPVVDQWLNTRERKREMKRAKRARPLVEIRTNGWGH